MRQKIIITKIIFSLIFIFSIDLFSQNLYTTENFVENIKLEFTSYGIETEKQTLLESSISNWNKKYTQEEKSTIIILINFLDQKKRYGYIYFLEYLEIISSSSFKLSSTLEGIIKYHYAFLLQNKEKIKVYFKKIIDVIVDNNIINSPSHVISYNQKNISLGLEDFSSYSLYNSDGTILGTLVLRFLSTDLNFKSNNDDFNINKSSFDFYLDLGLIEGSSGLLDVNTEIDFIGFPSYIFKRFNLDVNSGEIISNDVIMNSDKLKNIPGVFTYKPSQSISQNINNFLFRSNGYQHTIIINNKTRFKSGVTIEGSKLSTKNIAEEDSELKILLKNNKFLKFKSKDFLIADSKIFSKRTYFGFYDMKDSLYHSLIELNYDLQTNNIELLNLDGPLKQTPFYSTYFQVEINADVFNYVIGEDNMDFKILIAPNQRPLTVYSTKYFSNNNLNTLTDLDGTNILKVVYGYYKKTKRTDFYLPDLAYYYKLKPTSLEGGIVELWRNGFLSYDASVGLIKVMPKLRHYFLSHLKKSDYDEMYLESLSETSKNLKYNLLSNEMFLEGVQEIILSKKNNIIVYPKDGTVKLLKNRNIKSLGNISVGKFDFTGVDLIFDYSLFKLQLLEIDTLRILSKTNSKDNYNYLYNIGGDLFINHPKNKSSLKMLPNFPYFISAKSTRVYFDMPDEYGVEYDSSFYFSISQFRIDSLDKASLPKFEFEGTFYSNNILEPLDAKLITMPDNSLGFIKELDDDGLPAYNNKTIINNILQMDSSGLYVKGNFMYETTSIFSEKIRLFPDSIQGYMDKGFMSNGQMSNFKKQFPSMEINNVDFVYYNNKDDYLHLIYDSLKKSTVSAYDKKSYIYGDVFISPSEVISEGALLTDGAILKSHSFSYSKSEIFSEETSIIYNPYESSNEVLISSAVSLSYNLDKKILGLSSSYYDTENFILPYSSITTSFSNLYWDIQNQKIVFENIDNESDASEFYSTNENFTNLNFISSRGTFDIRSKVLLLEGVPEIQIADAFIIPDKGEVTIFENSEILPLKNAELILDTLSEYHKFIKSNVDIISKSKFEGRGIYEYINFDDDTFEIPFSSFELKEFDGKDVNSFSSTYSFGLVDKSSPILMEPGFGFYGKIELVANNEKLLFNGEIIPSEIENFNASQAISYSGYFTPGDELALSISNDDNDFTAAISKTDDGLFFNFFSNLIEKRSLVFFNPSGELSYDSYNKQYLIEPLEKTNEEVYNGNSLLYSPNDGSFAFEGSVDLIDNEPNFNILSSISATVDPDSFNISSEAFIVVDANIRKSVINNLGIEFVDIIEMVGGALAHDNEQEVLNRLSDIIGFEKTLQHESIILNEYRSIALADPILNSLFVITNSQLNWSSKHSAWYNNSSINLSNIGINDINAAIDGFLEVKYLSEDFFEFNIFLQPSPEFWIFFSYDGGILRTHSSIESYNSDITEIGATKDKYIPTMIVNEDYILTYINDFRLKYFNITEPYDLQSPSDTFLEDEVFNTITDDDDDGF